MIYLAEQLRGNQTGTRHQRIAVGRGMARTRHFELPAFAGWTDDELAIVCSTILQKRSLSASCINRGSWAAVICPKVGLVSVTVET